METNQPTDATGPAAQHHAKLARARKQVAAIKGFYIHLFVFVVVILGLLVINLAAGGAWWVPWIFLGWGVGVLAHAFAIYGHAPHVIAKWEERKIKTLMEKK
jgi:fatty acid desaturase